VKINPMAIPPMLLETVFDEFHSKLIEFDHSSCLMID